MIFQNSRQLTLMLFVLAALSLVGAGVLFAQQATLPEIFFSLYVGALGTWLLYGFDWRAPFKKGGQRLFLIQLFGAFESAFYLLEPFQISVLLCMAFIGVLYQIPVVGSRLDVQLKKITGLKNILIGLSWAALVLLGARSYSAPFVQFAFWFVAIQIGFGSIIRDISDVSHDQKAQVATLPIRIGIHKTIRVLHLVNFASIGVALCYFGWHFSVALQLSLLIIAYKALILFKVQQDHSVKLWTQYLNILTCLWIFLLSLFLID
jgi:4-hydroxybenzoate polyprenyltransferase